MKLGVGLYRHMLTREYYAFARQAGCTHVVIHLVDYFNQGSANPRNNQPTGGKLEPWGMAGDPENPWSLEELQRIRGEIEEAGLVLAAVDRHRRDTGGGGNAEGAEVRIQVGLSVASAQLDDADGLALAVRAGGKVVELRNLERRVRD